MSEAGPMAKTNSSLLSAPGVLAGDRGTEPIEPAIGRANGRRAGAAPSKAQVRQSSGCGRLGTANSALGPAVQGCE
jgi:hypothetical protein